MAERFKALVLKTSVGRPPTVGSNPTPTAKETTRVRLFRDIIIITTPLVLGFIAVAPFVAYSAIKSELDWRKVEK